MKVLILCAGYATRLWPLTINRPKPLLRIGKKPIIEHIIARFEPLEHIDEIFVITNSKFVKDFKNWQGGYQSRQRISIIDDGIDNLHNRLGSVGDIIFTIEKENINSDIIVVGGDNIFNSKIDGFIDKAKGNSPYATIGLHDVKNLELAKKYGVVELNGDSRIVSFEEKPLKPKSTLAAMCLYFFPKDKLALLKSYKAGANPLDLAGHFIKWLSEKEAVYGYIFEDYWLDIGDRFSLKRANEIFGDAVPTGVRRHLTTA